MQEFNSSGTSCITLHLRQLEDSRSWPTLSPRSIPLLADSVNKATMMTDFQLPADLCFGILVFLFLLIRIIKQSQVTERGSGNDPGHAPSLAAVTACFLFGVFMTPVVMVSLPLFFSYRLLVHVYLKRRVGVRFAGLLKGPDVVWAMELPEARSIITVLVVLEVPPDNVRCLRGDTTPGKLLLRTVRKVAQLSLLAPDSPFPKLIYLRKKSRLGYHYWVKSEQVNVDTFVRCLNISEHVPNGLSENELQCVIGEHCNKPMPFDDTATWEILVGQQPLLPPEGSLDKSLRYPIIFRVHHTVGDGVALLRLLLEGLADRSDYKSLPASSKQKLWSQCQRRTGSSYDNESQNAAKHTEALVSEQSDPSSVECSESLQQQDPSSVEHSESPPQQDPSSVEPTDSLVTFYMTDAINPSTQCNLLTPSDPATSLDPKVENRVDYIRNKIRSKLKTDFLKIKKSSPSVTYSNATEMKMQWTKSPKHSMRALATATVVSKIPLMKTLSRAGVAGMLDLRTCVVPPQPRSISPLLPLPSLLALPSLDGNVTATAIRRSASVNATDRKKITYTLSELENKITSTNVDPSEPILLEGDDPPSCSLLFEKCDSYKTLVQSAKISDIPTSKVITLAPVKEEWKRPTIKEIGINVIVVAILSLICIKRAVETLLTTTLPIFCKFSKAVFFTPYLLFYQMFGTTDDCALYGKQLSGEKVAAWIVEGDGEALVTGLRAKIRLIREHHGGALKFTQVFFTCLSRSLHRFYLHRGDRVPSSVNVVLPARVDMNDLSKGLQTTALCEVGCIRARVTRLYGTRRVLKPPFHPRDVSFSSSTESEPEVQRRVEHVQSALSRPEVRWAPQLDNKFTVAMLKLPVGSVPLEHAGDLLNDVRVECNRLRSAPDYRVNYLLLGWVAHLAPYPLLQPFLGGAPSSLVLSNLPGPEDVVHLARRPIKDIVFWVPNRGLNGVGIGMLSYCGRFSLGIVADKALISSAAEARLIIDGIFSEVSLLLDAYMHG